MPTTTSDAAARTRIGPYAGDALPSLDGFDADSNFLVRASAGAGKTTSLVARLEALVRTGVPIGDLTAITFTRKAAGEMKERLFERLQMLQHKAPAGSDDARRLRRGLDDLSQCFVGTIHSFCARLLREFPLQAGLPPDFDMELDGREIDEMKRRAWQQYVRRVHNEAPERIDAVQAVGYTPADLYDQFTVLSRYPDLQPYTEDIPAPDLDEATATVAEFVRAWAPYLPTPLPDTSGRCCNALSAIAQAEQMLRVNPPETPAEQAALLALFEGLAKDDNRKNRDGRRGKMTPSHWKENKSHAKELQDEHLAPLVDDIVDPLMTRWHAHAHHVCTQFTHGAIEPLLTLRRDRGQLSANDLLLYTRNLLRDHAGVRRTLHQRYPRLLVDEFQDTDPLQAEILFYLTGTDHETTDWRATNPAPGSLFVVGDDKQSIYRFRRADMAIFNDVADLIDAQPYGEALTLTRNFRSTARLCHAFNTMFDAPFTTDRAEADAAPTHNLPADAVQAEYTDFDPHRTTDPADPVCYQSTIEYKKYNRSEAIAEADAERIARYIHEAATANEPLQHGPNGALVQGEPGDFMILTRVTSRLSTYAEALARYNIPYVVMGGKDAHESRELHALVQLLTCVFRPDDPLAHLAYLQGPLVGFSDDALYRLKQHGLVLGDTQQPAASSAPTALRERLATAQTRISDAHNLLHEQRPAPAIEALLDDSHLYARAAADATEGSLNAGRLQRILAEVQAFDARGFSAYEIWRELQYIADGNADIDGMTLDTGSDNAVQLLNVHKAKGLQANVVFLADPYGGSRSGGITEHVRRQENEIVVPVLNAYQHNTSVAAAPEAWPQFEAVEAVLEDAEAHRLEYVAATRAKQMLVVSRYHHKNDGYKPGYWRAVDAYCSDHDVPELPRPNSARPNAPTPHVLHNLQEHLDEHQARRTELAQHTYRTATISETAHSRAVPAASDSYENTLGNALHALIEQVVMQHPARPDYKPAHLRQLLIEHEAAPAQHDVLQRMLDALVESPLWNALAEAETIYTELPLSRLLPGDAERDADTVQHGTIDLAYRTGDAWHLVDYKSDRIENPTHLRELARAYASQLRLYATAWNEVMGTPPESARLWFADAPRIGLDAGQPVELDG
ncbi:ATP-dependent DNA helicase [Longimonas halophila]|uniref:DNA 3'-5' helicase n=1 Tax=Longimonas halophila TaxID=1469170 RepID=A0A2H3P3E3_9BACT|nr:UvrD-helicase domain-containing protein [Longimonas halophila]PEN08802.1 ATP-dependent DNA helicase [Longimonas halophila]